MTSSDDDKPISPIAQTLDATAAPDPLVGKTLGHYRIVSRLGAGGMGVVYHAEDEKLRRAVALKVLPDTSGNEERRQRFLREARSAAAIAHPNVAVVHQVDEADGRIYIAMELVKGKNLRARMEGGRLELATAKDLALQIARGLAAAHEQGIVHRDLKPENVMITPAGIVKLLDFGLAKVGVEQPASGETEVALAKTETVVTSDEGRVMGTPEYMSPEQALGQPLDVRSDVFSLGIVMYEMLSGARPFGGTTTGAVLVAIARDAAQPLRERAPGVVDEATEAVVMRCLAKAPGERFANAAEVVAALEDRRTAATITQLTLSPGGVVRSRMARGALALFSGIVVVTAAVLALRRHRGVEAPSLATAPSSAASVAPVLRLSDLPLPKTDKPEALKEYRRALGDLEDGIEPPQVALGRAVAIDPDFAAAHLRMAFVLDRPSSTFHYRDAFRTRDRLDERDRALLEAEAPRDVNDVPDLAETKRRFEALLARRSGDVEILYRLALLERDLPDGAPVAAYERVLRADPHFAYAEAGLSHLLAARGQNDEALEHARRCLEISPVAALCYLQQGEIAAAAGRCDALAEAADRALRFAPDDFFVGLARLNASLTTEEPRDAADARLATIAQGMPTQVDTMITFLRGVTALWYGSFTEAYEDLDASRADWNKTYPGTAYAPGEQLAAAEEAGDEAKVRSFLTAAESDLTDPWLLRSLREHHLLTDARVAKARARLRDGAGEWFAWLRVDAGLALTAEEARAALARMPDALDADIPLRRSLWAEYEIARVRWLAGDPVRAIPLLEDVVRTCEPFPGGVVWSYAVQIVRGSLLLGEAREATGDRQGACAAYATVQHRWGQAKPRSVTADDARARATKLGCGL